jgi:hypothetical protein
MLFTENADEWLDQVDPWSEREALDLLQATESGCSIGLFDCASVADGARWFVMAPHAERVLLLSSAAAWRAFIAEVADRFNLRSTVPTAARLSWSAVRDPAWIEHDADVRAVNDSRLTPLLDQAGALRG